MSTLNRTETAALRRVLEINEMLSSWELTNAERKKLGHEAKTLLKEVINKKGHFDK